MPEATQYMFNYRETVTALIKQQGLHEGIWGLAVQFDFGAVNLGGGKDDLAPAAIARVVAIGLQRLPEATNLSVDAAEVNPAS